MSTEWKKVPDALTYAAKARIAITKEWARGWDDCLAYALAASPPPAAQPEQPEPGVLTDERIDRIFDFHNEAPTMSYRYEVARAIEREVLSTRKLSDEQVARIMEVIRALAYRRHADSEIEPVLAADDAAPGR